MSDQQAQHPARILVSTSKKPLYFYVNLAKRLLQEHGEVHLSALGLAISTAVTVAELLKKDKLAVEKKILTAYDAVDDDGGKPSAKPRLAITLVKSPEFDSIMEQQAQQEASAAVQQQEKQEEEEQQQQEEEQSDEQGEPAGAPDATSA